MTTRQLLLPTFTEVESDVLANSYLQSESKRSGQVAFSIWVLRYCFVLTILIAICLVLDAAVWPLFRVT